MTNQTPYGPPVAAPRAGVWARLSIAQRAGLVAAALLVPCCGGLAVIGAFADNPQQAKESRQRAAADAQQTVPLDPALTSPSASAAAPEAAASQAAASQDSGAGAPAAAGAVSTQPTSAQAGSAQGSSTQGTSSGATTTAGSAPSQTSAARSGTSVSTRTVTETKSIAYSTRRVKDSSLAQGDTEVRTKGVTGIRTLTYRVTTTADGHTTKKLVRSAVTRKPITKVIAVGTHSDKCDPNYSGCVPIASDVDCAGGSGNGPAYVSGPIKVIGSDIYDLDRDNDGYACDD